MAAAVGESAVAWYEVVAVVEACSSLEMSSAQLVFDGCVSAVVGVLHLWVWLVVWQ